MVISLRYSYVTSRDTARDIARDLLHVIVVNSDILDTGDIISGSIEASSGAARGQFLGLPVGVPRKASAKLPTILYSPTTARLSLRIGVIGSH